MFVFLFVRCPEAEVVAVRPRRAESPANEAGHCLVQGLWGYGVEGVRV